MPTLVLQAILLWQRMALDEVTVVLGSHVAVGEKLRIPIDERGEMRVNFGAPFTTIGFDELLLANEQVAAKQKVLVPVDQIAHSVALLARVDAGAEKLALGRGTPGTEGELLAAAIATIQTQSFLRTVGPWWSWTLLCAACLLALWVPVWKKRRVALGALAVAVLYALVAMLCLATRQLLLPLVLPFGLVLFVALYRLATPNNVWKLKRPIIL